MADTQDDTTTETGEAAPVVTFGRVVTGPNSSLTLVDTVSPASDVASIEIASFFSRAFSDYGPAVIQPDGSFSFDLTGKSAYAELLALVEGTDGEAVSSGISGITLVTDISEQPYTSIINYSVPGTKQLLESEYVKNNGRDYYTITPTARPDGGTSYTYAGGSYFFHKDYFGFVDSYNGLGVIGQHTEYGRDGVNTTDVLTRGEVVTAIGQDVFNEYAGATKFIVGEGVGAETFNGFRVGGLNHDTVNLPAADAGRLGRILANATRDDLGTTLHLGQGDSLTFTDVSPAALRRNARDFTFGA